MSNIIQSQDCGCSVDQVEANTVEPCNLIVGEIDTVSTVSELWASIRFANNNGGNRTILIADGTYDVASTASYPYITANNIVFRSLSGNRDAVVLTGQGMANVAPATEIGIFAVGDNISIADLTISGVGNHGIAASGNNLYVHNVKIKDTYEQMIKGVSANNGADSARVQCSLFEYTSGIGPQWYIGGLDIHDGDNWIVNDNVFKNIASPSQSLAEHAIHFWNSSSNNIIERNRIINCDRGIGFGLGSSRNDGGIIRNNMIYNDGTHPFDDVGIGLETSPSTKVYNNTIHIEYPNAIEYRFEETTGVEIANNITNKLIRSRNGGQANLQNNYTDGNINWYRDANNGQLHLEEFIDEVVNQGINLSPDVMDDIDQTGRPIDSKYDIGAHEYGDVISSLQDENIIGLNIFPNPVSDVLTVRSDSFEDFTLQIYSGEGKLLQSFISVDLKSGFEINLQDYKRGIYFIKIISADFADVLQKILVLK